MYSFFPYCVTVCLGTLFSWSQTLPTITKQGYKLCQDLPLTLRSVLCQTVEPVTIFTCTHCNLYDLFAHWYHKHLGIKSCFFLNTNNFIMNDKLLLVKAIWKIPSHPWLKWLICEWILTAHSSSLLMMSIKLCCNCI